MNWKHKRKANRKDYRSLLVSGPVPNNQWGFSLFELLVVLMLLTVLAAVTLPATGRFLDNLQFRKKVAAVTSALRYARLLAITRGVDVHVVATEGDGRSLRVIIPQQEAEAQQMRSVELAPPAHLTMEPTEVVFLPEGYATPAVIVLAENHRSRRIFLDPLTALPEAE